MWLKYAMMEQCRLSASLRQTCTAFWNISFFNFICACIMFFSMYFLTQSHLNTANIIIIIT